MLALLMGLVGVIATAAPASAAPPDRKRFMATFNMLHSTAGGDMWLAVAEISRSFGVIALQEVPRDGQLEPVAPHSPRRSTLLRQIGPDIWEYEWRIGRDAGDVRYVYLARNATQPLGIITTQRADHVTLVQHPTIPNSRTALVIAHNDIRMVYASIHGFSGNGNDGVGLVTAVRDATAAYGAANPPPQGGDPWNWAVLGDFNRDPSLMRNDPNRPANSTVVSPTQGSQLRQGNTLDYMVTSLGANFFNASTAAPWSTIRNSGSDHLPVLFSPMAAGGPNQGWTYRFTNPTGPKHSVISIPNGTTVDGAAAAREAWKRELSQIWRAEDFVSDGINTAHKLINTQTNKCLTLDVSRNVLQQAECRDRDSLDQLWLYSTPSLQNMARDIGPGFVARSTDPANGYLTTGGFTHEIPDEFRWAMEPIDLRHWDTAGFPAGDQGSNPVYIMDGNANQSLTAGADHVSGGHSDHGNNDYHSEELWNHQPSGVPGGRHVVNESTKECLTIPASGQLKPTMEPCQPGNRHQAWEYVNGHLVGFALGVMVILSGGELVLAAGAAVVGVISFITGRKMGGHISLAVMPLGDSITLGVGSSTRTGYRPALAQMLAQDTADVKFVGSMQDADGSRHEGHSGWRIDQISANIDRWMADAKPNVVVLHLGTNDMNRNYEVATAPQRLGRLIDQIHDSSPDTVVVVASLVPAADPAVQARVNAYNRAIPGIVTDRAARGYRITQVSMGELSVADLNDNLHPNNNGYAKMARAFQGGVATASQKKWIVPDVTVKPAPPEAGQGAAAGDYRVDVNGDGRSDYLVVQDNGAVRAWVNSTGADGKVKWSDYGSIASGSPSWTGAQVRFADVGGDARADYLVLSPNGAVRALINQGGDGRGGWQDAGTIASGSTSWNASQVRFADVGGDARADYLILSPNGAVRAFVNTTRADGTLKWDDYGTIASGSAQWTAEDVRFADVGGDARADYLIVEDNGAVRSFINQGGDGHGGWGKVNTIATGSASWTATQVRFADVGGDSRADYLILADNGALTAYFNETNEAGATTWSNQGTIASGTGNPSYRVRIG
ncbi:GDSL-type esterase/lipase family protein [Streptomyces sp. NPDC002054]|uniref:GDSL-type esterase/lipase family protein n=1 Tax=Streptomyces sp. NPDC002054 TaxID=3154663 RepID=UPI00332191B3